MTQQVEERTLASDRGWMFSAGSQCLFHCHHYNLFHDQTIDDILGPVAGEKLRQTSAQVAFGNLFRRIAESARLSTQVDRIEVAQSVFSDWGQGRILLQADPRGGKATGQFLHYGFSWLEKYGAKVRRSEPADAVAGGAAAGAIETAFNLEMGSLTASERTCVAKREPTCEFVLGPAESRSLSVRSLGKEEILSTASAPDSAGPYESEIEQKTGILREFLSGVKGDERGLISAFSVWVTLHLADYYCATAFEAIRALEAKRPSALAAGEALLREAGHVCVFNTFGNILASPEWEGLFGPLSGKDGEIIVGCAAIARALGFGRWSPIEVRGRERLVVRTYATYEVPHWLLRYGVSDRPRTYFFQGAVQAFQVLAHRVQWRERPKFTQEFYEHLFHGGSVGFRQHTSACMTRGDSYCEVVVDPEGV